MKEILAISSNDIHLKEDNIIKIHSLFFQKIELAESLNVKNLFCLGDVFESRTAQRLSVLIAFSRILDMIKEKGMMLYTIPGNHDKTNYRNMASFLEPFEEHPALELIKSPTELKFGLTSCTFLPFFDDKLFMELSGSLLEEGGDFCFTHMGIQGSKNNDGSEVNSSITKNTFKNFKKTFSGHYHDKQEIGNYIHLPSICQNNFGEDQNKGFTIIYTDGTYEVRQSDFPTYSKVSINVDEFDNKQIMSMVDKHQQKSEFVRFEFEGKESKIKSIKSTLSSKGIDVKVKSEVEVNTAETSIKKLNRDEVIKSFKEFCEQEELEYQEGIEIINESLKTN